MFNLFLNIAIAYIEIDLINYYNA